MVMKSIGVGSAAFTPSSLSPSNNSDAKVDSAPSPVMPSHSHSSSVHLTRSSRKFAPRRRGANHFIRSINELCSGESSILLRNSSKIRLRIFAALTRSNSGPRAANF